MAMASRQKALCRRRAAWAAGGKAARGKEARRR